MKTEKLLVLGKVLVKSVRAKSIRLDIYIEDQEGNAYDLEMQSEDDDGAELGKRIRYYASMIDTHLLDHGMKYSELTRSLVVFICKYDPFGYNLLKYTFSNLCHEQLELELPDNSSKVILNTKGNITGHSDSIINFAKYINTGKVSDKLTEKLAKEVDRQHKNVEKAVGFMTYDIELQDQYRRGEKKGKMQTLFSLVNDGSLTKSAAAKNANMTLEEFERKLAEFNS